MGSVAKTQQPGGEAEGTRNKSMLACPWRRSEALAVDDEIQARGFLARDSTGHETAFRVFHLRRSPFVTVNPPVLCRTASFLQHIICRRSCGKPRLSLAVTAAPFQNPAATSRFISPSSVYLQPLTNPPGNLTFSQRSKLTSPAPPLRRTWSPDVTGSSSFWLRSGKSL